TVSRGKTCGMLCAESSIRSTRDVSLSIQIEPVYSGLNDSAAAYTCQCEFSCATEKSYRNALRFTMVDDRRLWKFASVDGSRMSSNWLENSPVDQAPVFSIASFGALPLISTFL